jgi:N-acetylmuramoyl-L-alanine amidase
MPLACCLGMKGWARPAPRITVVPAKGMRYSNIRRVLRQLRLACDDSPLGFLTSRDTIRRGLLLTSIVALFLFSAMLLSAPADEKHISIYSAVANYTLPVAARDGRDYVDLFEILEPLGMVSIKTDGRHWRLRYKNVDGEFTAGKTRARIQGRDSDLPANFLLERGRGLVPLASLSTLMPRFLGAPVTFHESSRRMFIDNVAVHFTAQISKPNPPNLVMDFSSPVNPMIATEPGKLRMVFTHEALVPPGSQTLTFDSKSIPSASYEENNGAAEITIVGTAPLLASFSNDGRTIIIAPAPQVATPPPTPAPGLQAAGISSPTSQATAQLPPGSTVLGASLNRSVTYFAVVDASHGGDERGAALTDQLAEKDVTLALARRLRQELDTRGLTTLVLRDGDTTVSLDQRARLANSAHPAIYICIHAASQGTGVRLYTALLPAGGNNRGSFLDWDTAQSSFRSASQIAEAGLVAELGKRQIPVRSLVAPLRPLNNITAAAVAIEVAPPEAGVPGLASSEYEQIIAGSVAAGVAAVRDKLEAGR